MSTPTRIAIARALLDQSRAVLAAFEAGRRKGIALATHDWISSVPTVQRLRQIDEAVNRFRRQD